MLYPLAAFSHETSCPTGGVDGQRVAASSGTTEKAGEVSGNYYKVDANWLCCNHAAGACTDFDTLSRANGAPTRTVVSLEDTGTCTGVDVTIGFRNDASGVNHTVGTLSLATDSLVIDGPRPRFITATVNTMAGGTCAANPADIRVDNYYKRTAEH